MQMPEREDGANSEINILKRRLILSWIFATVIILLMFYERIFGAMLNEKLMTVLFLVLSFPIVFIFGLDTIKSGIKGLVTLYFNMDSLIALGTLTAYITGFFSLFFEIQDYSSVSAMIMAFFITGRYIESVARGKASQEMRKLLELGAKNARVVRNNKEIEIPIEELKVGDIFIVKPGEKISTDGKVVKGISFVDESMISGESMPIEKKVNSLVIGATLNQDGVLYVKATKIGSDTFLAHVISLVEEAQGSKIPIQKAADRVTSVFVPVIIALAVLTFSNWLYFSKDISISIAAAVAVLVIACPCALGLATPTALMVGSGMGAQRGILIRKGEAIQTMKNIKIIAFDKTGTITKGVPEVTDIYSEVVESKLLQIAASLEKFSEHPVAKAIVKRAGNIDYLSASDFKVFRGRGVKGKIRGSEVVIGNRLFMKENKISTVKIEGILNGYESEGKTTMIVALAKKIMGVIAIADTLKEDSIEIIKKLNDMKYKVVMISGDNETTANAIAKKVGITQVVANVLPEEKSKKIEELQRIGMTAYVGDGINDAPAIKQANVGIAIGTGSDIAIESGDIVLVNGSLTGVLKAINLSKATFGKIKQNLFLAFIYNACAIPLAAFGFFHPAIAEAAMALSSVSVVANANLLRRAKI